MAEPVPASDLAINGRTHPQEKLLIQESRDADSQDDERTLHPSTKQSTSSTYGGTDPERGGLDKDEQRHLSTIQEKDQAPLDPNIVDWDGPDDPEKPTNWAASRKYGIVAIISSITFLTYAENPYFTEESPRG